MSVPLNNPAASLARPLSATGRQGIRTGRPTRQPAGEWWVSVKSALCPHPQAQSDPARHPVWTPQFLHSLHCHDLQPRPCRPACPGRGFLACFAISPPPPATLPNDAAASRQHWQGDAGSRAACRQHSSSLNVAACVRQQLQQPRGISLRTGPGTDGMLGCIPRLREARQVRVYVICQSPIEVSGRPG